MNRHSELARLDLPDFGLPRVEPEIPAALYRDRIERASRRAAEAGCDLLLVYGDREHSANIRYLTGYDPRFEEALFLIDLGENASRPLLLVGNEGYGYAGTSPIRKEIDVELFQSLSLLGQDRTKSRMLDTILSERGVRLGRTVGTAGWKHFDDREGGSPETMIEIPAYIVDILRTLTGDRRKVRNVNGLFMSSTDGLRVHNEVEQLAFFEFSGTFASESVRNVLEGVRPGMTELEAALLLGLNGLPLSCHPMLSAGDRASFGMGSPSMRTIGRGERFTTAVGLWGALTSRAGFLVESARELPEDIIDYVERLVAPYFDAIVAWYEIVGIGVPGGELFEAIDSRIGGDFFGVGLNPGHQIHLDEWVNSPIYAGSTERLHSGTALQVDVIPATGGPYFTTNIEDGVLLADAATRERFRSEWPDAWARIEARREFMLDELGITLKPEVLPTSNIPAFLPPFVLAPDRAMRMAR